MNYGQNVFSNLGSDGFLLSLGLQAERHLEQAKDKGLIKQAAQVGCCL